jgi:hypothetical protein
VASASTIAALQKMYKTVYMGRDLANQSIWKTPAYDAVEKFDDFDGANLTFPFNQDVPTGVSAGASGLSIAQSIANSSTFDNWVMTQRKEISGVLTISAEAMRASRKDIGAWLRARQKETNEILAYMKMILGGHAFWGDGAGDLAQATAVAGGPPLTSITVAQAATIRFHKKQRLQFNPNRTGNAGTLRTDIYEITGINRVTGVLTVNRVSGAANDVAANDYVYLQGTYDALPIGVQGFIPASDPGTGGVPAALLGMTRTDDPTMKAGWRVPWQGSISESAKYTSALMGQYMKRESSALWVSRYRWYQLEQDLEAVGRKVLDARATAVFGSPALLLLTPEGEIPVVSDPFCPNDAAFLLDHSQIETHHLDPLIHIVDDDGLPALRQTADHGIEVRARSWSENIFQRPFRCARFPIVGA